jgi:hypothetical protein
MVCRIFSLPKLFLILAMPLWLSFSAIPLEEKFAFPAGEEGAQQMLEFVLQANDKERAELSLFLRPEKGDCEAIFDETYARKIFRYQKRLEKLAGIVVRPLLEDQTEYLLWETTPEELIDYTGEARNFPGGYREMAQFMPDELPVYRFKFVQPGHRLGSAYDMLVHINGKWRLIHRPWVVLFE